MSKVIMRDLMKQVVAKRKESEAAEAAMYKLLTELSKLAPHKVGDIVEGNDYSHKGKPMKVEKVNVRMTGGGRPQFEFCYYGKVVRKSGAVSNIQTRRFDPVIQPKGAAK